MSWLHCAWYAEITRGTSRYPERDVLVLMLGHTSIDCSQRYVDLEPATLQAMFADAI